MKRSLVLLALLVPAAALAVVQWRTKRQAAELEAAWADRSQQILEQGTALAERRFAEIERQAIERLRAAVADPALRAALERGDRRRLQRAVAARPPAVAPEGFLLRDPAGRTVAWSGAPREALVAGQPASALDSRVAHGPGGAVLVVCLPWRAAAGVWRFYHFRPLTAGLLGEHPETDFDAGLGREFGRPIRVFGKPEPADAGLARPLRSASGHPVARVVVQRADRAAEERRLRARAMLPSLALGLLLLVALSAVAARAVVTSRLRPASRCALLCLLIACVVLLALQVDLTRLMPDEPLVGPTYFGVLGFGPFARSPITLLVSLAGLLGITLVARSMLPPPAPALRWRPTRLAASLLALAGVVLLIGGYIQAAGRIVLDSSEVQLFPAHQVAPDLPALLLQGALLLLALVTLLGSDLLLGHARAAAGGAPPVAWSGALLLLLALIGAAGALGGWPGGPLRLPVYLVALAWFCSLLLQLLREYRWAARALVLLLAAGALSYPTLARATAEELVADARYEARRFDWEAEAGKRNQQAGVLEFAADRMAQQLEQLTHKGKLPPDVAFDLWRTSELASADRLHCHVRVIGPGSAMVDEFKLNMPPWSWYRAQLLDVEQGPTPAPFSRRLRLRRERHDLELSAAVREVRAQDGRRWLLSLTLPFLADRFRPDDPVPGMYELGPRRPAPRLFYLLWDAGGRVRSSLGRRAHDLPRPVGPGEQELRIGGRAAWIVALAGPPGTPHAGKHAAIGFLRPDATTIFLDYVRLLLTFLALALLASPIALVELARRRRRGQRLLSTERRILVAFLALSFLPLLWLAWLSQERSRAGIERGGARELSRTLASLANVVALRSAGGELDPRLLDAAWCRQIGDELGRVFLIYREGALLSTSHPELVQLGLVPRRPSIAAVEALLGRRARLHVETRQLGLRRVQVGYAPLLDDAGRTTGLLATPALAEGGELDRARVRSTLLRIAIYGLVLLAVVLCALLLARWITRPVEKLLEGTRQVAAGNLEHRIAHESKDEFGELVASFNRMIHELQLARETALDEERADAFRTMARQIAHEIKNPLTPMKLSTQHLRDAFEKQHPRLPEIVEKSTRTLVEQIDALTRIANEFSAFAKFPRRRLETLSLEPLVEEVCQMYDDYEGRITVVRRFPAVPSPVRVDRDELRRILINLFTNAVQAIADRGTIVALTERTHLAALAADARERPFVELKLVDDGPGIPVELLTKIFRPNFSTRTAGTGLGLAICKKSITELGGEIQITSTVGQGTAVSVLLPIAES